MRDGAVTGVKQTLGSGVPLQPTICSALQSMWHFYENEKKPPLTQGKQFPIGVYISQ